MPALRLHRLALFLTIRRRAREALFVLDCARLSWPILPMRLSITQRGSSMENSTTSGYVKNGQTLADKAADKVQSGIRDAQHAGKDAGTTLSNKVDDLRSDAGPALAKVVGRAQSMGRQ